MCDSSLCELPITYFLEGDLGSIPRSGIFPWRRKWQSTPALLPGKSHGQRSLGGYSPWGHKELDTTEQLHFHYLFYESLMNQIVFFVDEIYTFLVTIFVATATNNINFYLYSG